MSSGLHPDVPDECESELEKMLLLPQPEIKKSKYEPRAHKPSTSGFWPPFKVRYVRWYKLKLLCLIQMEDVITVKKILSSSER